MSRYLAGMEKQYKDAEEAIKLRDRVLKLQGNRDFVAVINEEFLVKECARYAHESADPALRPENRADALNMAQAAGHLKRFFSVLIQKGNMAEGQLENLRTAIDQERAGAPADITNEDI